MEALAIRTITTPAQNFTPALFNSFVEYIDRTEKTTRTYLCNLRQFMAWLRYAAITAPVREDIISYRAWLAAEHDAIAFAPGSPAGWKYRTDAAGEPVKVMCKPSTIKAYLQSVRQFFAWTAANGLYENIAANIHAPKISTGHKKDSLAASDVVAIENSIIANAEAREQAAAAAGKDVKGRIERNTEQGKRLYAMYLLAVNAGLRCIEISRANVKDIETKGGRSCIYIWGKGRAEPDQKKPLAPEVMAAITDYLNCRKDAAGNAPLFTSTGNRSGGKRIASTTISTMLKRALQAAGFNSPRLTAHSLRHTTAANVMQMTGNNIYMAQQYLRHTSPKTTEIYLENDTAATDEALAGQLYNHYHGTAGIEDKQAQLRQLEARMNPEQLEQLLSIASAIVK